ncbi:hypothetical protein [Brachybacterium subflavum]|uniref:hypothetical protein n=1 Tax=Brachybacterium subflavum TaxID=2585206 RepID=UPI00126668FB|nr:hypothetical protein [Brachybacterium subflavum]
MDLDVDDTATLMTLLDEKRPTRVTRYLLSGWDMLQTDVPSRERIEGAAAVLVGTGLAAVDADWGMQLTAEGPGRGAAPPGHRIAVISASECRMQNSLPSGSSTYPSALFQNSESSKACAQSMDVWET